MKVLGISGSMRRDGNTATLIWSILDHIEASGCPDITTEFISLAGKVIRPCTGCDECKEKKWCIIQNDDWNDIIERVLQADVLILGSPTYYYDVSGQIKNFIDRTYSLYHDRKLAGRHAVAVAVCSERGGERTLNTLEGFLNTHEFSYIGYVCGRGSAPGDVKNDEQAMKKAAEVADKIINVLSKG